MTSASTRQSDWIESLYERLADDGDGRVCRAISDEACQAVPGNFVRMLVASTLSGLADKLASAKTTLPWLLAQAGAPGWMLGLLVPIRESGSMLPQLLIGAAVRRLALRKWVWVAGAMLQAACLAALGGVALALQGAAAGWALLGLLVAFSLARGACSVAYKDVQGKTIPKTRRGRLSGWISAAAGLAVLAVGLMLGRLNAQLSTSAIAGLLLAAALCWALAGMAFARIVEQPGATDGGVNGLNEAWAKLALLRDDVPFRQFVVARAMALGSALAAPFYIVLARDALGGSVALLGAFVAVEGLAGLASSPLWGRWADRSSRRVFAAGCSAAALLSIAVAFWSWLAPPAEASRWFYPVAFFALGVAHAGVRLGRKTYVVDMADGNRRTDYVAVGNSVIGVLLLAAGLGGALLAALSVPAVVALAGLAGLIGAGLSLRWREVSD